MTADGHALGVELLGGADPSRPAPARTGTPEPQLSLAMALQMKRASRKLRKANENTSAGFLVEGGQEQLIQGLGRIQTVEDIATTLVTMRDERRRRRTV